MARKPHTVNLDDNDIHALLFDSRYLSYEFVYQLNEVFEFSFQCENDIEYNISEDEYAVCPRYSYYDEVLKLLYIVIDNPVAEKPISPALSYYDKILFVVGQDAREVCHALQDQIVNGVQVENVYDVRRSQLAANVALFRDNGILQVDYLDIDPVVEVESTLLQNVPAATLPKMRKRVDAIAQCIKFLFDMVSDTMEMEELDD